MVGDPMIPNEGETKVILDSKVAKRLYRYGEVSMPQCRYVFPGPFHIPEFLHSRKLPFLLDDDFRKAYFGRHGWDFRLFPEERAMPIPAKLVKDRWLSVSWQDMSDKRYIPSCLDLVDHVETYGPFPTQGSYTNDQNKRQKANKEDVPVAGLHRFVLKQ